MNLALIRKSDLLAGSNGAQSKASTAFDSSNTGIVGSNPSRGMNESGFFCVVLLCRGSSLATV